MGERRRDEFRLIVTLPTTGTTTEHFKDYALHCGLSAEQIGLTHSRSSVDLDFIAEPLPKRTENVWSRSDPSDRAEEMFAAQQAKMDSSPWGTPLVVATADTVLGLMANARKPVYSFPGIMQWAIVFDEVHAYDDDCFGHLLAFLENFPGIPVMLMTASLPKEREDALRKVRSDLHPIAGPSDLECRRRYSTPEIIARGDEEEVWELSARPQGTQSREGAYGCGTRWIGSMKATGVLDRLGDLDPWISIYRSRFRYKDRVGVDRQVIDEFKRKRRTTGEVLVASQVAEMSLNLFRRSLGDRFRPDSGIDRRYGRARYSSPGKPQPLGRSVVCNCRSGRASRRTSSRMIRLKWSRPRGGWANWLSAEAVHQRDLIDEFAHWRSGRTFDLGTARGRGLLFGPVANLPSVNPRRWAHLGGRSEGRCRRLPAE